MRRIGQRVGVERSEALGNLDIRQVLESEYFLA